MKKFACRYAIVRFAPFPETEEFANVGIVVACPAARYFGFKLQTRKYARVTAFFDELKADVFRRAVQLIKGELDRIQHITSRQDVSSDDVRNAFETLVHRRETIVRFGEARAALTDDPKEELGRLFDFYVDRSFATPEYIETSMQRRLNSLLNELPLQAPFRPERIGDAYVHARFPFVQKRGDKARKIIKPFNLAQPEPNGIFEHGDTWVQKVRRLRSRALLPDRVLFAVAAPPASDKDRFRAFSEIQQELEREGVLVVGEKAESEIADFATA